LDPEETPLYRAGIAQPESIQARLDYVQWLVARGDARADYLKLELELQTLEKADKRYRQVKSQLRLQKAKIDRQWRLEITQTPIENCGVLDSAEGLFEFECPQRWNRLTPTDEPSVRFCDSCKQHVHFCSSLAEAEALGARGACIAIDVCAKPERLHETAKEFENKPIKMGRVVSLNARDQRLRDYPSKRVEQRQVDEP
jgi:hypothetical protein